MAKDWTFGPTIGGKLYSYDENHRPIHMAQKNGSPAFNIPEAPGEVHYLTTGGRDLGKAKAIRLVYDLLGDGSLKATEGETSARIRLHFQRSGDNWSGNGQYEHYRFWSVAFSELLLGKGHVLEAALTPDLWLSVYGQVGAAPKAFKAAKKNCQRVGFTFGGQFAGHGVRIRNGKATFVIREFEID